MFIAFVQRKGWLRFNGDPDYLSALWRDYQRKHSLNETFYDDRLVPLFFAALNTEHDIDVIGINGGGVLQDIIGDVPYLNGGLFEKDADDEERHVAVSDASIDAILHELFARFNFTVTESTPWDVEVAVDPEMLGKVFEELVTGRHETGSYYTPKPVVAFMCHEALKGYLRVASSGEAPEAIDRLINERDVADIKNPELLLDALRRVTVCDPACGSGAYLLGMLHELLDLRQILFAAQRLDPITAYERKLEIIQSNLYGVDIDPFAVNIARLRLWLSLVVDYQGAKPPPLPNLDFKIEVGDSLTAPDPSGALQPGLHADRLKEYLRLKAEYMTAHGTEKAMLRRRVAEIKEEITAWMRAQRRIIGFDWPIEFAEVFLNGGFDVVLANPPYVRHELIQALKPALKQTYAGLYIGTADLYVFFYYRALQLLRADGMLVFISSNKWLRASYGRGLRQHMATTTAILSLTDFHDLPVFEAVMAYPLIVAARKAALGTRVLFTRVPSLDPPYPDVEAVVREYGDQLDHASLRGEAWPLYQRSSASVIEAMTQNTVSLVEYVDGEIFKGIETGLTEAFVIGEDLKEYLLSYSDVYAEIIKPMVRGTDLKRWAIEFKNTYLLYIQWDTDIRRYPKVLEYLDSFKSQLSNRNGARSGGSLPWYALRRPCSESYKVYTNTKILYPDIAKRARFCVDKSGFFPLNTAYCIPSNDLYLLAVLNSDSVHLYYSEISSQLREDYLRFFRQFVERIPVPQAPDAEKAALAELAQRCVDGMIHGVNIAPVEAEINERVAWLYGLSPATVAEFAS